MTETKSYYRKAAHRAREIYKGRILKEWRVWNVIKFEIYI